ncbi:protoheme IX farnesyltransferase [Thermocladium modestius]|uniref:Protoheme IX farnesyltransferase n=2 Tax=Thermocladium modestius TaxID=62609 RepID=A0A830GT74_9CREN|nr:heme o synthase [Thermocladium modestius]GGP20038.1 protoheme IX farnesyltransferase [Thermocladium modestius]
MESMKLGDAIELMKPRVIWLLVLSAIGGYLIAAIPKINALRLVEIAIAGLLSTGGSAAANMLFEKDVDALMTRTAKRPLPAGSISVKAAWVEMIVLTAAGLVLGYIWLGLMPFIFMLAGWVFYSIIYTLILKRRTWLNILIGGFAGNAALLSGWAAAAPINLEAMLLSFAVYLWIPAHIWSLVMRYSDDYRKAGIPMLPVLVRRSTAISTISGLNILSTIYMLFLYVIYVNSIPGYIILLPFVAMSIYISAKSLLNPTDDAFWTMFKMTSPILTMFILAAVLGLFMQFPP